MTKYAMLVYVDGVYNYIPLDGEETKEEALRAALEYISDNDILYSIHDDIDDLDFNIIEVANNYKLTTIDHQGLFKKKIAAARKRQEERQNEFDRKEFERLKKKLEKEI